MSTARFLSTEFASVRSETERRAEPLSPEDRSLQSMPECSPTGQVRAFIEDGGYRTPSLWLAAGFDAARSGGWEAPLHTRFEGASCDVFGPEGEREAADAEPARHLSANEADAIARWSGARLPTEAEREVVALGEYNGKFMVEQLVLRGGSDFTPPGHSRPSYRNFWPAATRFQRTGARLARDLR